MSGSRSWQAGRRPDGRQAEWSRRSGRRSLHESRRSRTLKLVAALGGLVLLVGLVAYLASLYNPVSHPALAGVGDPLYRDLAIPPNAGAVGGNHIDVVRLHEDAGYLFAPAAEPSSQDWNLFTADRLLQESRDRLEEICRDLPSDERTIVIYFGLLGLSRDGKAVFLVSDESGTDEQIPASDWIASLSSAAEKVGARVLMLIDPGPGIVSWSEGVLAPDFAAQLEAELDDRPLKNVCLILASGPGEASWRVTDLPTPEAKSGDKNTLNESAVIDRAEPQEIGRSVFSHYVVSGLRGAGVDSSGKAKGTADDGPKGNRDGRITADELFAFVAERVDQWATSHRGVHQTVKKLAGRGDFLVGVVTKPPSKPKPLVSKKEATAASDAKTPKADATDRDASSKEAARAANAERRLGKLWEERDRLMTAGSAFATSPDEWQELQTRLLAVELRLRMGLSDAAVRLLSDSEQQMTKISASANRTDVRQAFGGTWYRPFLPTLPAAIASKQSAPTDTKKVAADAPAPPPTPELAALLDEAAKVPPSMPIPNEQAVRDRLAARESLSAALDWAVAKGSAARTSADWAVIGRLASLMPASEASLELRAIQRFANASKDWSGADGDVKASLAARVLKAATQYGQLGLDDPAALSLCRQSLAEGLLATAAAERWLILAGDSEETERHLRRAESTLQDLKETTSAVSSARRLLVQLQAQLPELAVWAATVREREPKSDDDGDSYGQLRELSKKLDVVATHEASHDWGALQREINDAWSFAAIDDERRTGFGLSTLVIGERHLAALLHALAEPGSTAADREALKARLLVAVEALKTVPHDVSIAIAQTSGEPTWADIDRRLQFASLPGLTAGRRLELRQELQAGRYMVSSPSDADASPRWEAGTWHGFWSRQVLKGGLYASSNGSSPEKFSQLERAWQAFLDAVGGEPGSRLACRTELAAAIRGLVQAERQSPAVVQAPTTQAAVSLLLGLFADFNALSGDAVDLRQVWSSLPIEGAPSRARDENLVFRSLNADVSDDEAVNAKSESRGAVLSLHAYPEQGHLLIKSGSASNPIDVFVADQRVQGGDLPAETKDPKPTVQFRSNLTGNESVIVALVDRDQFPVSIQRVRVVPEVGEDRWRIRFASAISPEDVLSDAPEVVSLPAQTAEPLALLPMLEFPAAAPTQNVVIEVQQRDSATSNNWRTVLGPKTFSLREGGKSAAIGDLRRIVLDFTPASTPQPQAEPTAATTIAATKFSFENGLRFLVRIDGTDLPPRDIFPVTFDANRFVSEDARALDVSLEGMPPRIEALVTASTGADPRIPKSVPIELEFDSRLNTLVGGQKATEGLIAPGTGETLRLFGEIADDTNFEQLLRSTGGVVALNIAGLPRAYRWRLRQGQEPDRIQPTDSPLELEFVKRTAGPPAVPAPNAPPAAATIESIPLDLKLGAAVIDANDLDAVSLRYFVHQFDDRSAPGGVQPRPWTVIARRSEPGRPETTQVFFTAQIVRRFSTQMNASVTGAVWSVSVESEPHEIALNFAAQGRFEVTAALHAPGREETEAASQTIRLVIDGSVPEIPTFVPPTPVETFAVKGPLPVVCTTSDEQSGLVSLEIRVDSNGDGKYDPEADAEQQYDESKLTAGRVNDPWFGSSAVKVRWDVPVALLPPAAEPGKPDSVMIWAVAVNRLGKSSESKRRIDLKREKPKPPPTPPSEGDIIVTVIPKPRPPVEPEIVLANSEGVLDTRSGKSATFSKLKAGKYEIRVTQGSLSSKGQGKASVTVEAGKTTNVTITVK